MKQCFAVLLLLVIPGTLLAQQKDTFSVYFPMDVRQLPAPMQQEIDSLFYSDWIHTASNVAVIGFADYVGGAGSYNGQLSRDRAKNVAQYLQAGGIRPENILLIEGKGAVERPGLSGSEGFAADRRVMIVRRNKVPMAAPQPQPQPVQPAPAPPDLSLMKENETLTLENIYFFPGQHIVRPESYPAMEKLLEALKKHPEVRVRIEGHICCVTSPPDGLDIDTGELSLSRNRARSIYNWLIRNGISKDRLEYQGFGRTRPLVPVERTEEDANKNRRVEIRKLSKM